ncbi:hypothetical protein [Xenorhabdus cabanillasii]|uniref:Uncharacterized protein n=1 Tax=Xenorhabdus cabanillasii JM26 TaxID=1427517 RepID=W1JAT7_9GAMM|nr:hypothetical protein [Xenorhabdus cabanillasii]PHM76716.1 hypothetical protein Xcab_02782 [Xenorhabdus cabanillasii JM26]CDL86986.1 exported hypothetical protein [Xenorhabdus cabanillasii JM26]
MKSIYLFVLFCFFACSVSAEGNGDKITGSQLNPNITVPAGKNDAIHCNKTITGYIISVSTGYNGNKNWLAFTIKNKKGQNWFWAAHLNNTDAGKSLLSTAIFAASSGQKIYAECDNNSYITSLWVGPDAW